MKDKLRAVFVPIASVAIRLSGASIMWPLSVAMRLKVMRPLQWSSDR